MRRCIAALCTARQGVYGGVYGVVSMVWCLWCGVYGVYGVYGVVSMVSMVTANGLWVALPDTLPLSRPGRGGGQRGPAATRHRRKQHRVGLQQHGTAGNNTGTAPSGASAPGAAAASSAALQTKNAGPGGAAATHRRGRARQAPRRRADNTTGPEGACSATLQATPQRPHRPGRARRATRRRATRLQSLVSHQIPWL